MLDPAAVRPPSEESRRTAAGAFKSDRVAYRVAREIAVWMLEIRLPEGARFPPEQELCRELGCSRIGLRSALRLLEQWGLITIQTGRNGGPIVRVPRVTDLKDPLSILIHSEHATLMDVLVARRAIDPVVAAAAATNATPELIEDLRSALDQLRRARSSQREFLSATAEFQGFLADASALAILGLFLRILASFGEFSVMQRLPLDKKWQQTVVNQFERILKAVEEHDADAASSEMLLHRVKSEQHWHRKGANQLHLPLAPFEFGT